MKFWCAVLLLLFFSTREILAQSDRAAITGAVHDPSGALIAGASVTATKVNIHLQWAAVSSPDGAYTLLNLPIGQYDLVCTKEGFKARRLPSLDLAIGETLKLELQLAVGTQPDVWIDQTERRVWFLSEVANERN